MANQEKSVTFIARKHSALRIVLDPSRRKEVAGNVLTEGLKRQFKDKLPVTVEFIDGQYITSDKDVIKAMKAHEGYGFAFYDMQEDGVEPTITAIRHENDRKALVEELRSQCPECGKKFQTSQQLNGHMATHSNTN